MFSKARLMAALLSFTPTWAIFISLRAVFSHSAISFSCGTSLLIMPNFSASCALSVSPVSSSSLALASPTLNGVIRTGGPAPKRISGSPNTARSEAILISQSWASSQAPPRAYPLSAAMSMKPGTGVIQAPEIIKGWMGYGCGYGSNNSALIFHSTSPSALAVSL